jgi:hypothetical protein
MGQLKKAGKLEGAISEALENFATKSPSEAKKDIDQLLMKALTYILSISLMVNGKKSVEYIRSMFHINRR